jgi:hypothetical protein
MYLGNWGESQKESTRKPKTMWADNIKLGLGERERERETE